MITPALLLLTGLGSAVSPCLVPAGGSAPSECLLQGWAPYPSANCPPSAGIPESRVADTLTTTEGATGWKSPSHLWRPRLKTASSPQTRASFCSQGSWATKTFPPGLRLPTSAPCPGHMNRLFASPKGRRGALGRHPRGRLLPRGFPTPHVQGVSLPHLPAL